MSDVLKGKILLARLPQGVLGLQKTNIIGTLLLSQLHIAALVSADVKLTRAADVKLAHL